MLFLLQGRALVALKGLEIHPLHCYSLRLATQLQGLAHFVVPLFFFFFNVIHSYHSKHTCEDTSNIKESQFKYEQLFSFLHSI